MSKVTTSFTAESIYVDMKISINPRMRKKTGVESRLTKHGEGVKNASRHSGNIDKQPIQGFGYGD